MYFNNVRPVVDGYKQYDETDIHRRRFPVQEVGFKLGQAYFVLEIHPYCHWADTEPAANLPPLKLNPKTPKIVFVTTKQFVWLTLLVAHFSDSVHDMPVAKKFRSAMPACRQFFFGFLGGGLWKVCTFFLRYYPKEKNANVKQP